ncbi:MAG: hypothetical protein ACLQFR_20885 [Streptosporangiaceae bacterium]
MPFALLVVALLGGGLISLLVINTTLGATSFRITQLQSTNTRLSDQDQALQQAIAVEAAPSQIAHRAYALGMRWQSQLNYLNPVTGRIYQVGARGSGTVDPKVPRPAVTSGRFAMGGEHVKNGRTSTAGRKATARRTASGTGGKTRTQSRRGGARRSRIKARAGSGT